VKTLRVLMLVGLVLLLVSFANGQVATGTPAFSSTAGSVDTVNLGNLNIHINVPIFSKAGRGLPLTYTLSYDSSVWYPSGSVWTAVPNWGWRAATEAAVGYVTYNDTLKNTFCGTPPSRQLDDYISGWTYHDINGVAHPFTFAFFLDCDTGNGSGSGISADGSGYFMNASVLAFTVATATVNSPSGTVINPPVGGPNGAGTVTDVNGNQLTVSSSGVITDTLNTTALTVSGSAPNPKTFTYTSPAGPGASYTINYKQYTVATNFGVSGIGESGAQSASLVDNIKLPDGSKYVFTYEATPTTPTSGKCTPLSGTYSTNCVTARIASITYPTGGQITYSYSGGSNGVESDGTTAGLTRTLNPGGTWSYSRSVNGTTWTTVVNDPKTPSNETDITFQADSSTSPTHNFYETQRKVYQGSKSSGTLLSTTITCYNGQSVGTPSNCPTTAVSTPINRVTVFRYLPDSTGVVAETDSTYGGSGSLIGEVDEYDYSATVGSGAVGPLIRSTITSYASLGNGIADRASSVLIKDGSGVTRASTTYTYDDPGTLTTTSGIPQHISVSGSRGNLTSVAAQANGTTTLYRKYTYYDTGTLNTSTDVSTSSTTNGVATTYNYTAGSASCNSAFPTSISEPLSLSRSMTWNCVGAVLTSLTDENGKQSSTSYTDPDFWRPASSTDAAGNTTTFTYSPDANTSLPTQTESTLLFNSNNSVVDILTTVDGFGRQSLSQRKQGPSATNYDTTETDYDIAGCGVSRTTLPYSATQGQTNSSAPATTTTYDGACRSTGSSDSGGGSTTYTYTYNDTYQIVGPAPSGENAKRKQLEYDGLGRLASACEITAGTVPAPAGNCAQKSSATGYWTTYTYNVLGNQTGVTQNAQATSGQQARTFAFDMLGRLTSEANPEMKNNAVTYSYDTLSSDASCGTVTSAGNMLKQLDAAGNAACSSYDSLHRITSVTYPSTSTPQKNFVYDTATVNSVNMVNAKTRLAEAYTCTGTCTSKITDLGLSYSALGQVSDVYQHSTNSSGYYHVSSTYWPNGAVNTLSNLTGLPTITYGADPEGRTSTVSASSGQNPVSAVSYNTASQVTAITFGSADNDAFTVDANTGRLKQYQFNMGTNPVKSDTGVLTWNPNWSLGTLAITDQIYTGGSHTCNYSHDDLGRVATANCGTAWNQTFSYDALGNIQKSATVGISFQPGYDVTTNRINTTPFTYDGNNGNLKTDNNHAYAWDTAGKMTSVDFGTANGVCLMYDALGRMLEQAKGSSCTTSYAQIVYAPSGAKLAIMNGQTLTKAFVALPAGQAVYTSSGLAYYRHQDWLGSSRLATTPTRSMYYDTAYAPFGENYLGSGTMDLSFTGQNQDTIGGGVPGNLYDFLYRQHTPVQGRWLSPDPAGRAAINPTDPQTWNRYAYVANRPLGAIDPQGLMMDLYSPFDGGGGDDFTFDTPWGFQGPSDTSGYCSAAYDFCGAPPVGIGIVFAGEDGGGTGAGMPPRSSPSQGGGRVWTDNETLGLPRGLNLRPASILDLLGLTPGTQCDFVPGCNGVGANDFTHSGIYCRFLCYNNIFVEKAISLLASIERLVGDAYDPDNPGYKPGFTDCDVLEANDLSVCRSLTNPGARARCYDSASQRNFACRYGKPLPPLIRW
jgi:RHS repeat-associated protein